MRRYALLCAAAAIMFLAAAPLVAAEVTRTLRVELRGDAAGPFMVENLAGTMRVSTGTGPTVVAIATVHAESDALAGAMRFEQVTGEGGVPTLRVRYPFDQIGDIRYPGISGDGGLLSRMFGGSSQTNTRYDGERVRIRDSGTLLYADVEVQVPRRLIEATFKNHVGTLRGSGLEGTLRFDTGSGDVTLEKVRGKVTGDTGSGKVSIADAEGSVRCDTGSGECDITGFSGDSILCNVGSGDVTISASTARSIDLDTGSGDVHVEGTVVEEFSADTGSGDVTLEAGGARLTKVRTDTGSGDVVLRLGPDASFEARADQGSGDLRCGYTDAEAIVNRRTVVGYRRGDGRTRIDVNTGSGDLVLEPGGPSARAR